MRIGELLTTHSKTLRLSEASVVIDAHDAIN